MMGGFIILDRRIIIFDRKQKKETRNESPFVVDRGIEPLCQDWESCILTIRWIDQHLKERFRREIPRLRKEGDSNPRYGNPYGSLANCWFQPLTHPSLRTLESETVGLSPWLRVQRYNYFLNPANFLATFFSFSVFFFSECVWIATFWLFFYERNTGLEPATLGLGSQCSTNWATTASFFIFDAKVVNSSDVTRVFSEKITKLSHLCALFPSISLLSWGFGNHLLIFLIHKKNQDWHEVLNV